MNCASTLRDLPFELLQVDCSIGTLVVVGVADIVLVDLGIPGSYDLLQTEVLIDLFIPYCCYWNMTDSRWQDNLVTPVLLDIDS